MTKVKDIENILSTWNVSKTALSYASELLEYYGCELMSEYVTQTAQEKSVKYFNRIDIEITLNMLCEIADSEAGKLSLIKALGYSKDFLHLFSAEEILERAIEMKHIKVFKKSRLLFVMKGEGISKELFDTLKESYKKENRC